MTNQHNEKQGKEAIVYIENTVEGKRSRGCDDPCWAMKARINVQRF